MTNAELTGYLAQSNISTSVFTQLTHILMRDTTCSNCKFYSEPICENNELDSMADPNQEWTDNISVKQAFGCNLFEEK